MHKDNEDYDFTMELVGINDERTALKKSDIKGEIPIGIKTKIKTEDL